MLVAPVNRYNKPSFGMKFSLSPQLRADIAEHIVAPDIVEALRDSARVVRDLPPENLKLMLTEQRGKLIVTIPGLPARTTELLAQVISKSVPTFARDLSAEHFASPKALQNLQLLLSADDELIFSERLQAKLKEAPEEYEKLIHLLSSKVSKNVAHLFDSPEFKTFNGGTRVNPLSLDYFNGKFTISWTPQDVERCYMHGNCDEDKAIKSIVERPLSDVSVLDLVFAVHGIRDKYIDYRKSFEAAKELLDG